MLGTIVDCRHQACVAFRLASHPSEEAFPIAAHRLPPVSRKEEEEHGSL
jgi:hypothetical protein